MTRSFLLLFLLALPAAVGAQNGPELTGTRAGYLSTTVGVAWTELDCGDTTAWGDRTLAAGDYVVHLYVHNTHGANTVRVLGRAAGVTPTTEGFLIPAGEWRTVPAWGLATTTFALAADGAGTTVEVFVHCTRGGG